MQRIVASVLGFGLVAAVACGGKGADQAAVAVTGAEVGTVVEVEGAVTASRAGQARPLAVGQRVHDDDVVATGGGRVAIQLDKNHVVWRLGPRLTQQVAQSSAWSAPMAQADVVATTDEHSAAAGRHAEREAADTAASAVEGKIEKPMAPAAAAPTPPAAPAPGAPMAEQPRETGAAATVAVPEAPPPPAPPPPPPAPDPLAALEPTGAGPSPGGGAAAGSGAAGGDLAADVAGARGLGTATRDDEVPADRRAPRTDDAAPDPYFAPKAPLQAPPVRLTVGTISTRGPIASAAVRDQVAAARDALAACGDGARRGAAFTWTFRISAAGKVSGTAIKGGAPALVRCVEGVATGWSFAKAKKLSTAKVALSAQ
ncbi:MAG: hypothetical protein IPH44_31555 [Myxococcales bacterium]|nr:hypothetical protein [Myxococcales bacterium]MBK7194292.1 hypothetical protein [Myxococcales bacterium]MBP6847008.1 hypothetical protein [Kofleriaceae bacterium]